jgi:hypothetical protein
LQFIVNGLLGVAQLLEEELLLDAGNKMHTPNIVIIISSKERTIRGLTR